MAISETISTGPYVGNGVQSTFAFTFSAVSASDVAVTVDGNAISPVLYAVVIGADGTGTVTFSTPPAVGANVLALLNPDFTAENTFENDGAYTLATVNLINRRAAIRSNWVAKKLAQMSLGISPYLGTGAAGAVGADDSVGGAKWSSVQGFISYLVNSFGAGSIGTSDGSNVQAKLDGYDAGETASAIGAAASAIGASASAGAATTQAGIATQQAAIAAAVVLGLPYFGPSLLNASTAAGGSNILPQGIISGTVGGTAISGATPGTYALTATGGSFTGVAANLVVTSATAATIVVTNPGRTTSASPTAPTWANPSGATLPAGTTLTANIGTQIASGGGQIYLTSDSTGNYLLYWQNTGTGAPVAVATNGGAQVTFALGSFIASLGFNTGGIRYIYGKQVAGAYLDANYRNGWTVTTDGYHYAKYTIKIGAAANGLAWAQDASGFWNITLGTTQGQLPVGAGMIDTTSPRYYNGVQVAWCIFDSTRRPAIVVTIDGKTNIPRLQTGRVAAVSTNYVYSETTVSNLSQLFRGNRSTGKKTQITFSGNNLNASLSQDGTLITYASDRTGPWTYYWQPVGGNTTPGPIDHPVYPITSAFPSWGDSLTQGQEGYVNVGYYPTVLSGLLGRTCNNYGIGGQKSTQIAMRQGGVATALTLPSGQIVAGANAVSAINGVAIVGVGTGQDPDYRLLSTPSAYATYTCTGYLAGVHGTLSGTSTSSTVISYAFTPDAGYSGTTACPAGTAFYVDTNGSDDECAIIWSGRNNYAQSAQVLSDISAMVAFLKPLVKRFIIMGVINSVAEPSGSAGYNQIIALNNTLAATYGANFIDIRAVLVAAYNPANAADVVDHSNDVPPTSLRAQYSYTLAGALTASTTNFTLTSTNNSAAPGVGYLLLVGSEYIQITAITGYNVTSCVRGYAGTTAAIQASGAAVLGTETLHLNLQGYTVVANAVAALITANNW